MNDVPSPHIHTHDELAALLANIAEMQRTRNQLWQAQEAEINAVRQRYRVQLTELQDFLALELSWAESWARSHRSALGADLALATDHATLGFHAGPPRIERASRRWTWSRIAATLAALPWGPRYLRTPEPVVDQDAIVADLDKLSPDQLRAAGMEVIPGEQFFVTPHTGESGPAWQEAA